MNVGVYSLAHPIAEEHKRAGFPMIRPSQSANQAGNLDAPRRYDLLDLMSDRIWEEHAAPGNEPAGAHTGGAIPASAAGHAPRDWRCSTDAETISRGDVGATFANGQQLDLMRKRRRLGGAERKQVR